MPLRVLIIGCGALALLLCYLTLQEGGTLRGQAQRSQPVSATTQDTVRAKSRNARERAFEDENAQVLAEDSGPVRQRIREAIKRDVEPIAQVPRLLSYLDSLTLQASERGYVSALDVVPGMEAIMRRSEDLGIEAAAELQFEFGARMEALSRRLRGMPENDVMPTQLDFDDLSVEITDASDEASRRTAVKKYRMLAQELDDPEEQIGRMIYLEDLVGHRSDDVLPSPTDMASLPHLVPD